MKKARKVYGDSELMVFLRTLKKDAQKTQKEIHKMAATLQELQDAITAIGTAVDADVAQDLEVVRLSRILIDKIKTLPNASDFTNEVTALATATAKLGSDNAAVQTALDEAGTV